METRLLWKVAPGRWAFASYAWNDAQTDAELAPEGGVRGVVEIAPGRRHSIPSRADCAACHGTSGRPLGFGALQLSPDRDPNAIHGEPLAPEMLTLETLVREGRLEGAPPTLLADPPRIRASSPRTRAALGYLAANCGGCHNRSGEISANVPSLAYADVMAGADAVAESLIGRADALPGARGSRGGERRGGCAGARAERAHRPHALAPALLADAAARDRARRPAGARGARRVDRQGPRAPGDRVGRAAPPPRN